MSACLVCGATDAAVRFRASDRLYRTTTREFAVVRCTRCGLQRLDPLPSPEEIKTYYPDSYWFAPASNTASRLEETYRRIVLRDHTRFVVRSLRAAPPGPILDVGCGGGLFLGLMREHGRRVMGLDSSPEAASIAWHRQQVPALAADLARAPFRPASVACITMFHVLEHLYDPAAYLAAAHDLLLPGGRLVVQVPNAESWQARLLGRRWNGADVPRHLTDFRPRDLAQLLNRAGFRLQREKHFNLRDNPAGLASSLAPSLDPMARRIRPGAEPAAARLARDLAYFALVLASVAPAILEAAARAGATVMMEARRA
jgi:SAM-dependent methyltransferase